MISTLENNLKLRRFGQRFLDPSIEADYRKWRQLETFPVMLLGACVALLTWIIAIPAGWLFAPVTFTEHGWMLYGVMAPLYLILIGVGYIRKLRPAMLAIVSFMNLLAGVFIVVTYYEIGETLGGAAASAMAVLLYAPFMRLPPLVTFMACTPYISLLLGFTAIEILNGNLNEMAAFGLTAVPITGLMTVLLVCGVLENLLRRSYTREQLILEQQSVLEDSRRLIRRYIPPAVADKIISGESESINTPQRKRVTVLFCDMVGFTDSADRLDAESLTQILNEYMAAMAEIVEAHGGTLNEFAGDGLMALFGAPQKLDPEDQVKQAIAGAKKMLAKMPELNQGWQKLGLDQQLDIRIGINTGVLSVGSFGSEGRMTYTAIGLQTNIASRIESKASPGEILISHASWQLVKEIIDCEPRGEVECKGVHFPVKVFSPVAPQ